MVLWFKNYLQIKHICYIIFFYEIYELKVNIYTCHNRSQIKFKFLKQNEKKFVSTNPIKCWQALNS